MLLDLAVLLYYRMDVCLFNNRAVEAKMIVIVVMAFWMTIKYNALITAVYNALYFNAKHYALYNA